MTTPRSRLHAAPHREFQPALRCRSAWVHALALALALGLGGCGDDAGIGGTAPAARARTIERDLSPVAVALRAAIEAGDPDRAEELLAAAGPALGVERPCFAARIAFLRGDDEAWLRAIEEARALAPTDPRPYATAAELWSAAGRLDAARRELERGLVAVGELTPELERAKAVLALVTPGGARAGLDALERAIQRDPELPFVARARGQAHLLRAKGAFADQDPARALTELEQSLRYDPRDVEARELHAQALYANDRFLDAIAGYEALLAEGRDLRGELALWHKNAGLIAQLNGERAAARGHYLRARALGLTDVELASGVHFLRDEARLLLERGAEEALQRAEPGLAARRAEAATLTDDVETLGEECAERLVARALSAAGEGRNDTALGLVEQALLLAPDDRLARVLRARLYAASGSHLEAADEYRWLLADARAAGIELPEPLHLDLAVCLLRSGAPDEAKAALQEYLREAPQGRWAAATRERLAEL